VYEFGFSRVDITTYEPQMAMLGWGQWHNLIDGVGEPLHARTGVLRDTNSGGVVAYVCAELLLVSQALRQEVIATLERDYPELGIGAHNLVMTATHTHSGPSGFSHHFWVNLASPGYSDTVFSALSKGIVDSIRQAFAKMSPGRIRFTQGEVPLSDAIVFNRSTTPYSANAETDPISHERRDEACDRTMTVLRFEDLEGNPVGMMNWFPVHCTSVHSDNRLIHSDNKGLAARDFEERQRRKDGNGFCAIFSQEASGDVTPNYRYDRSRRFVVGRFDDDYESAAYVGETQSRRAQPLFEGAENELAGPLSVVTRYLDFSRAPADPALALGRTGRHTSSARLGLAMAKGTVEGPGPLLKAGWVDALARLKRRRDRLRAKATQRCDPKLPLVDLGRGLDGRLLGIFKLRRFAIPALDPTLRYVKQTIRRGGVGDGPWIPQILPLQLLRIGPLAIATMPFEVTTVAGRRLRETLLKALRGTGVETIIINGYANAYAGYLTTFEEYQCQAYEGGYTLFGPWSLAAVRTAFACLATEIEKPSTELVGLKPQKANQSVLAHSRFEKPWPAFKRSKRRH